MITAIEIENFRCFAQRQRIELSPITLLYGPNNSGKSTAMHAMLLFGEWLEYHGYRIGALELTGGTKNVGPSYLATHNHCDGLPICIKVEFHDAENDVRRSMEIRVKPGSNDFQAKATRRFVGDHVQLDQIRYESDGQVVEDDCPLTQMEILEQVKSELQSHRIIGALRQIPEVNFLAKTPHEVDRSLWYQGLAAWHWIGHALEDNLIWTNQWLGPEYLDTGVEFVQQLLIESTQLFSALNTEFPQGENLSKPTLEMCLQQLFVASERRVKLRPLQGKEIGSDEAPLLWPHEVGVGVTQILPVVVACMTRNGSFFMIQEPETHVHPRLQARLGDLLIDSTADHLSYGSANQLMVESHSEHLIHRLKRRIRETTKGTAPKNLELWADRVAINYFNQENGATRTQQIHLDINGEFVEPWPDDFFDLDFNERFAQ
jgi:predicted ATPase